MTQLISSFHAAIIRSSDLQSINSSFEQLLRQVLLQKSATSGGLELTAAAEQVARAFRAGLTEFRKSTVESTAPP